MTNPANVADVGLVVYTYAAFSRCESLVCSRTRSDATTRRIRTRKHDCTSYGQRRSERNSTRLATASERRENHASRGDAPLSARPPFPIAQFPPFVHVFLRSSRFSPKFLTCDPLDPVLRTFDSLSVKVSSKHKSRLVLRLWAEGRAAINRSLTVEIVRRNDACSWTDCGNFTCIVCKKFVWNKVYNFSNDFII